MGVQHFGLLGSHWMKNNLFGLHIKYIISFYTIKSHNNVKRLWGWITSCLNCMSPPDHGLDTADLRCLEIYFNNLKRLLFSWYKKSIRKWPNLERKKFGLSLPESFMRKSEAILTDISWLKSADAVLVTKSIESFSFVVLAILSTTLRAKEGLGALLSSLGSSLTSRGGMTVPTCPSASGDLEAAVVPTWSVPPSTSWPILELSLSSGETLTSISGISSFTLASVLRKCWWQRMWSFRLKWREEVNGHSWHWNVSPRSWCWWT